MEVTVLIRFGNSQQKMRPVLGKTIDVIVPSGTYYRVRGYHAASNGGLKESTSTLTQWHYD